MRWFGLGVPACAALLLLAGGVRADGAEALFPPPDLAGLSAPTAETIWAAPDANPDGGRESLFSMNLMLGMQTGVRAQAALVRRDEWEFVGEGYVGLLFTALGPGAGVGIGGRALWRRSSADGKDSLVLGPGIDLFYQSVLFDGDSVLLAPSMDFSWLHGVGDRGGWEIGLNIGFGVGLTGERTWHRPAAGVATPLVSLFTGFRF